MRTRVARRIVTGAIALELWLDAPIRAEAQDTPPVRLDWVAPPGCPTKSDVLLGVELILGRARGTRQAVTARAVVSRAGPERWQVVLTTRATGEPEGERTVNARSCRAVADAAALILALASNPESAPLPVVAPLPTTTPTPPPVGPAIPPTPPPGPTLSGTDPTVAPPPSPTSPPTPPVTQPTALPAGTPPPTGTPLPAPTPAPPETPGPPVTPAESQVPPARKPPPASLRPLGPPHHLGLSLSGVGAVGPLPNVALGGEAGIETHPWRHLRFEAAASYWGGQSTTSTTTGTETASLSLVSVDGRAGYSFLFGRFELVPSLLADTNIMRGQATGQATKPAPSTALWLGVGGGGWVFLSLTREIALRLGVEVAAPLARPEFQVKTPSGSGTTLFEPGVVAGKGTIGFEVRFL
jgi:hypothetical protein